MEFAAPARDGRHCSNSSAGRVEERRPRGSAARDLSASAAVEHGDGDVARSVACARRRGAGLGAADVPRSLLTIHALTSTRTGAVAAGARDGWAYVWPRDAATAALALEASGHRARSTARGEVPHRPRPLAPRPASAKTAPRSPAAPPRATRSAGSTAAAKATGIAAPASLSPGATAPTTKSPHPAPTSATPSPPPSTAEPAIDGFSARQHQVGDQARGFCANSGRRMGWCGRRVIPGPASTPRPAGRSARSNSRRSIPPRNGRCCSSSKPAPLRHHPRRRMARRRRPLDRPDRLVRLGPGRTGRRRR